jgi:hypothetical protein
MKLNLPIKFKRVCLIIIIASAVVGIEAYEYWVFSSSPTPQEAIVKYIKAHAIKSSIDNIRINDTSVIDSDYGKQFIVDGITGDYENITFFYLKENNKGWTVVTAGTGP